MFQSRPAPPSAYKWVILVASCLVVGVAFGLLISVSVFLRPLEQEFGWDRSATSFAYSSASFMAGVLGIGMGRLVDRIPPRPIVLTGALVLGAAHLLLAHVGAIWQLYLCYGLLVGGLGVGCFMIPLLTNVGFWFDRNRGLAIGVLLAGQSLGGALMPALSRALLAGLGWRGAYTVLGLGVWALLIPLALLMREPPGLAALKASAPAVSGGAGLTATRLIATLCVAIVCCCVCMSIPILHIYPLAAEGGFSAAEAATVLAVMLMASIVGRVGVGKLADQLGGIRSLLLASGIQTATIFWISQVHTLPGLLAFAVLFGIGYGGVVPSYAIIIRELLPARRAGTAMGIVFFFGNVGMSLGGYLGGLLYTLSGGYPVAYGFGALAGVANLAIVSTLLLATRARQGAAAVAA